MAFPPFERGACDWYVQILESTLHFWSRSVQSKYGSKMNTNKVFFPPSTFSFVCVVLALLLSSNIICNIFYFCWFHLLKWSSSKINITLRCLFCFAYRIWKMWLSLCSFDRMMPLLQWPMLFAGAKAWGSLCCQEQQHELPLAAMATVRRVSGPCSTYPHGWHFHHFQI